MQENAVIQVDDSDYGELERSKHAQGAKAGSPRNFLMGNCQIGPILRQQLADRSIATTQINFFH